ncbi:Six-hairpin glycosidase-like protein [Pelagophyceae sp. CCMP2097]|nr:Six-hairpin glycosidase-like protein [Pelagophyceae sp. CCMP2097]|mmetsp:Transcript_26016/g.92783  ORF Transcript_26016/g.92783 Transcript_26016/m.92783 type:complete len:1113 (-) Transcript_26016:26-3364(-)
MALKRRWACLFVVAASSFFCVLAKLVWRLERQRPWRRRPWRKRPPATLVHTAVDAPPPRPCAALHWLNATDLPGADVGYTDFKSPSECCDACVAEIKCVAWTVGPGGCWLKGSIPTPVGKARLTSGVLPAVVLAAHSEAAALAVRAAAPDATSAYAEARAATVALTAATPATPAHPASPRVVAPKRPTRPPPVDEDAGARVRVAPEAVACCGAAAGRGQDDGASQLWATQPGADWSEAWPLGNGALGALVKGEPWHARIALAEETFYEARGPIDEAHSEAKRLGAERREARRKAGKGTRDDAEWFAKPATPHAAFQKSRAALLRGDVEEAQDAARWLDGGPVASFLGMGSLRILVNGGKWANSTGTLLQRFARLSRSGSDVSGYSRRLDVNRAVASDKFVANSAARVENHRREHFASHASNVFVSRYACETRAQPDGGGCLDEVRIGLERPEAAVGVTKRGFLALKHPRFTVCVRLVDDSGNDVGAVEDDGLLTLFASGPAVTVLVAAATDYRGGDFEKTCEDRLIAASLGYDEVKRRHVSDFKAVFGQTRLNIHGAQECPQSHLPTAQRVLRLQRSVANETQGARDGGKVAKSTTAPAQACAASADADDELFSLAFNYARYLLISSSRAGGQPANLQGVWADGLKAPWAGDYHLNINLQMCYWPALTSNLAETAAPLVEFVSKLAERGRKTAREWYNASGWVAHAYTDIWGDTRALGENKWALCVTCGAWAALAAYEAFEWAPDNLKALDSAVVVLEDAVRFFRDYVVPISVEIDGKTVQVDATGPTTSPENSYLANKTRWRYVALSPAMDVAVLMRLYEAYGEACGMHSDVSFCDSTLVEYARGAPARLPHGGAPLERGGLVEEYPLSNISDSAADVAHRHFSGLWPWMPGRAAPTESAIKTVRAKLAAGGGHTGWSRAWAAGLQARLGCAAELESSLRLLLAKYVCPTNLLATHPPLRPTKSMKGCQTCFEPFSGSRGRGMVTEHGAVFQLDGNLGLLSAMTEALLQSHRGPLREPELILLPALPTSWRTGAVYALRARGGFEVELHWAAGVLVNATVSAKAAGRLRVRSATPLSASRPSAAVAGDANVLRLSLSRGDVVVLFPWRRGF